MYYDCFVVLQNLEQCSYHIASRSGSKTVQNICLLTNVISWVVLNVAYSSIGE
jgi:hypothetical protein